MTAALLDHRGPECRLELPEPELPEISADVSLIELNDVGFSYADGGPTVFDSVSLSLSKHSRIAVTGKNGSGKSTLVGLLTGMLEPTSGHRAEYRNIRVAHLTQHHADKLDMVQAAVIDYLRALYPKMRDYELLEGLEAFGIDADMARQPVGSLSGGQRVRVAFAEVCAEVPQVLVLDEPTNHLDICSIDALAQALSEFPGCVVLVTHNKFLLESVADEVWGVA